MKQKNNIFLSALFLSSFIQLFGSDKGAIESSLLEETSLTETPIHKKSLLSWIKKHPIMATISAGSICGLGYFAHNYQVLFPATVIDNSSPINPVHKDLAIQIQNSEVTDSQKILVEGQKLSTSLKICTCLGIIATTIAAPFITIRVAHLKAKKGSPGFDTFLKNKALKTEKYLLNHDLKKKIKSNYKEALKNTYHSNDNTSKPFFDVYQIRLQQITNPFHRIKRDKKITLWEAVFSKKTKTPTQKVVGYYNFLNPAQKNFKELTKDGIVKNEKIQDQKELLTNLEASYQSMIKSDHFKELPKEIQENFKQLYDAIQKTWSLMTKFEDWSQKGTTQHFLVNHYLKLSEDIKVSLENLKQKHIQCGYPDWTNPSCDMYKKNTFNMDFQYKLFGIYNYMINWDKNLTLHTNLLTSKIKYPWDNLKEYMETHNIFTVYLDKK